MATWRNLALTFCLLELRQSARGLLQLTDINSTFQLFIGAGYQTTTGSAGRAFNGYIDEVVLWNRALTASEVWAIYNAAHPARVRPAPAGVRAAAEAGNRNPDLVCRTRGRCYGPRGPMLRLVFL